MKIIGLVLALLLTIRLWKNSHKNVVEFIRSRYGQNGITCFRSYENSVIKKGKCELDQKFLETCKIYDVVPKFLRFKLHKKSLLSAKFYKSWQTKLLLNEIRTKKKAVDRLTKHIEESRIEMKEMFSSFDMLLVESYVRKSLETYIGKTRTIQDRKLENLGIRNDITPCDPDKIIFNFSDVTLTPRLKFLLAFGLDFGLPVFKLSFEKYFLCFEKLAYQLKNLNKISCF